jgi:hypothetical protein
MKKKFFMKLKTSQEQVRVLGGLKFTWGVFSLQVQNTAQEIRQNRGDSITNFQIHESQKTIKIKHNHE